MIILINKRGFGLSFTGGRAIPSSAFRKGYDYAAPLTSTQRFIYVSSTGGLFFDKDGTGNALGVQIATLNTGLAMTNNDIVLA